MLNLKTILALRKEYQLLCGDKQKLLDLISQTETSEQVYNSNAIENSTLTLNDTEKVLLQIELDKNTSQREFFEAKNLALVVEYIHKKSQTNQLNIEIILSLHAMLLSNIDENIKGRLRKGDEWVKVGNHIASSPENIHTELGMALIEYFSSGKDVVEKLTIFHLTFEKIHPFMDGNGRIGRVLNNYLLLRDNFVAINIRFIDRAKYYKAFDEFNTSGKTKIMQEIIVLALSSSYHKRLAYMQNKNIILLSEYAKSSEFSAQNLINKAKRQTIRAFWERGKWWIGS